MTNGRALLFHSVPTQPDRSWVNQSWLRRGAVKLGNKIANFPHFFFARISGNTDAVIKAHFCATQNQHASISLRCVIWRVKRHKAGELVSPTPGDISILDVRWRRRDCFDGGNYVLEAMVLPSISVKDDAHTMATWWFWDENVFFFIYGWIHSYPKSWYIKSRIYFD